MRTHDAALVSSVHALEGVLKRVSIRYERITLRATRLFTPVWVVYLAVITMVLMVFCMLVLPLLKAFQDGLFSCLRFSFPAFNPYQPPLPVPPIFF